MKNRRTFGKLAVVLSIVALMSVATAAPVIPAAPEAGTISTGSGVQVWNGHNCPASVPVNIAGLSTGLGGYETRITWPAGRFSSAPADVTVNVGTYLTNGGTRQQAGDSGTPPLLAVGTDTFKFGNYSWGAGNPPGNSANGQLATSGLKPTATCGNAALTMSETQLVDVGGALIPLTNQTGSSVAVFSRYDINGVQSSINSGDVNAVVAKLGQSADSPCGPNYRYNVNLVQSTINSGDVNAVVAKLGQSTSAVCVN
ncbi:MAG: hypothetical protein KDG58_00400 [Anaerolineae bacterium]|nr:hypothetical protein [Anaerolineae bacterium]